MRLAWNCLLPSPHARSALLHIDLLGLVSSCRRAEIGIYQILLKSYLWHLERIVIRNSMHLCRSQNKYNIGRRFLHAFCI